MVKASRPPRPGFLLLNHWHKAIRMSFLVLLFGLWMLRLLFIVVLLLLAIQVVGILLTRNNR